MKKATGVILSVFFILLVAACKSASGGIVSHAKESLNLVGFTVDEIGETIGEEKLVSPYPGCYEMPEKVTFCGLIFQQYLSVSMVETQVQIGDRTIPLHEDSMFGFQYVCEIVGPDSTVFASLERLTAQMNEGYGEPITYPGQAILHGGKVVRSVSALEKLVTSGPEENCYYVEDWSVEVPYQARLVAYYEAEKDTLKISVSYKPFNPPKLAD